MNKTKIIILSLMGFFLVTAAVFGYFVWSAVEEKGGNVEDLDTQLSAAERMTRLAIYPGPESVQKIKSNGVEYASWREKALKAASEGDLAFESLTPPAFKTQLIEDAKKLSELPGQVEGKIVRADFPFGFKDYIVGSMMPTAALLPRLQREWNDITNVVLRLSEAGIKEIESIELEKPRELPMPASRPSRKKGRERADGQAVAKATIEPDMTTMTVEFKARPSGIVNVVNALAADRRFIVVDSLAFEREKDEIVEKLGGDQKKTAKALKAEKRKQSLAEKRKQARANKSAANAEAAKAEEKEEEAPVITEPSTVPPFKVTMKISVYDFRTRLASAAADEEQDGEDEE